MGLSKQNVDIHTVPYKVDFAALGEALKHNVPEIEFAYIMGSAAEGEVKPRSDLDIAVFLKGKADLKIYDTIQTICGDIVGPVRCDLGFLNTDEPVYRFEAIKGRLLFARNRELWMNFYSLTCREYENQMLHYARQRKYRLEVSHEL